MSTVQLPVPTHFVYVDGNYLAFRRWIRAIEGRDYEFPELEPAQARALGDIARFLRVLSLPGGCELAATYWDEFDTRMRDGFTLGACVPGERHLTDVANWVRATAAVRCLLHRPQAAAQGAELAISQHLLPTAVEPAAVPTAIPYPTRLCTRLPHVLDYEYLRAENRPPWDPAAQMWSLEDLPHYYRFRGPLPITVTTSSRFKPRVSLTVDINDSDRVDYESIRVEVARPVYAGEGDGEPAGWESVMVSVHLLLSFSSNKPMSTTLRHRCQESAPTRPIGSFSIRKA